MAEAEIILIEEGRLLALGFPPAVAREVAAAHARGRFRLRPSPDLRHARAHVPNVRATTAPDPKDTDQG